MKRKLIAVSLPVLLMAAAAISAAADKMIGGPYVVHAGAKSATVAYITQTAEVMLGSKPGEAEKTGPVLRSHKVTFTGLKPGQTYHYNVNGTPEGKGQFKTSPAGAANYEFMVYGDTRTRHDFHRKVMASMVKTNPDFVLHTGDLVSDGSDTGQWPVFFEIEKDLLRKTAFFPVLGNHERNNPQYYDFFDVKTPYYSFDWGGAHFVILNSDLGNVALSASAKDAFWSEQQGWLEDDLKKSQKAAMRFVIMHHPPITAVKRRQGGNQHVVAWMPLFEKYKVTAVFTGHDHNYQHHVKNGVHYVVTGGGGAPLYPVDAPLDDVTRKVESTEHFVVVKVTGNKARLEALGLDGRQIDAIDFGQ